MCDCVCVHVHVFVFARAAPNPFLKKPGDTPVYLRLPSFVIAAIGGSA